MSRKLQIERLEPRTMLSADAWIGGSGNWNQPGSWSNGVPTATSTVTVSTSSALTITIPSGVVATASSFAIPAGDTLALPSASGANLITNTGFESPASTTNTTTPSDWWTYGTAYVNSQFAYTGEQSLEVYGNSSGAGQSFNVAPGSSYSASVYAMTPQSNPLTGSIGASMQLLFYDSNGNQISSYSPPNSIAVGDSSSAPGGPLAGSVGNQGWNFFSTTAVAPAGAATASLILNTYAPNSPYGGTEYFDDAQLVAGTVEPAQLSVGAMNNQGTLLIGAADSVAVSGGFKQTSSGKLEIQMGGAPAIYFFGSLAAAGSASLAGSLQVDLTGGYVPATTDSFIPVTYASETGSFASANLPSGVNYRMAAATTFTNVAISAAPASTITTTVSTASGLRAAPADLVGVNAAWWDDTAVTSETEQMESAAGIRLIRFPGGSDSDDFHFNVADNYSDSSAITIPQFAEMVAADGGTGVVTTDYGSGSPQEAAAELAYLEGSPADTTAIGNGIEWNDSTKQWQTVNWGTVGYWASLRAATPLEHDDGLNFLRIDHAAPFSTISDWEIGNEEYGGWEIDHHGTPLPGGSSTGTEHDPATYAAFAEQFATLAHEITTAAGLPAVLVGIDSGDPTGDSDNNWTRNVLADGDAIGFVPGFISDHSYMQAPGSESDSYLLDDTVSASGSIDNWSVRYADYETILKQTVGSQASGVQLLATEFNSVYTDPGKQSTSLVNGLFIANSLGSLLDSGYAGSTVWDLRNGPDPTENNSNSLYGWRETGDFGVLGTGNDPPTSGSYVAYPSYFALQLVSKAMTAGGEVVAAASNYSDLDTYALVQPDGDLELLVINTNPAATLTSQFDLTGFQPSGGVQVWQYGEAQDTAQSQSSSGSAALTDVNSTLTLSGADFDYSFPAYSMTVLDVKQSPTVATSAAATVNATTGKSAALSALGHYNSSASGLTYTWSTVGTPPAPVTFSPNGTSTANDSTATFTKAGTYQLEVTITSPTGTSITSSVAVNVPQTLSSFSLDLASSNLATSGTDQFAATGLDQFGNALSVQPSLAWSVSAGPGTIDNTGRFTPPYVSGSSTVKVSSGGVVATQMVTLPGPAVWSASAGGAWNSSANWQSSTLGGDVVPPGTRGNSGDTAELETGGGGTVTLNGTQPTLAALSLGGGTSGFVIAPGTGGTLQLQSAAGNAAINVLAGNQTIQSSVDLLSNTTVAAAKNSSLTLSGAIVGSGSLNIIDGGTVTLSGPNTFTGGTAVVSGSLIVENGASLGGGLVIGAGSTVTIAPSPSPNSTSGTSAPGILASGNNSVESAPGETQSAASSNPAIAARLEEIAARRQAEQSAELPGGSGTIPTASTTEITPRDSSVGSAIPPAPSISSPSLVDTQPLLVEIPMSNSRELQLDSISHGLLNEFESVSLEIGCGVFNPAATVVRPEPLISSTASTISLAFGNALTDGAADPAAAGRVAGAGIVGSHDNRLDQRALSRLGIDTVLDDDGSSVSCVDASLIDLLESAIPDSATD